MTPRLRWLARTLEEVIFLAGGAGIAYVLSLLKSLAMLKVLNLVGMFYGLLGIIVVSEFLIGSPKWRNFVVTHLCRLLIVGHLFIWLGVCVTAFWLFVLLPDQFPSADTLSSAALGFVLYFMPAAFFLEDAVWRPLNSKRNDVVRTRIFGFSLIIAGAVLQLVAAVRDIFAG